MGQNGENFDKIFLICIFWDFLGSLDRNDNWKKNVQLKSYRSPSATFTNPYRLPPKTTQRLDKMNPSINST
jgi:hypothetical protein